MRPRVLAAALAATAAFAAVPALAAPTSPVRIDVAADGLLLGDLGSAAGDPRSVATGALSRHADQLGVNADAFRWETVRTSRIGVHVRGREFRGGVAVDGTAALVSLLSGRVAQVEAYATELAGTPVAAPIGAVVARRAAHARLGVTSTLVPSAVERLLVRHDGRLVDAYRVGVVGAGRAGTVDVAAADGRVLAVRDDRRFAPATATATVFDPNPMVRARNLALRQPGEMQLPADADLDSAELTAALSPIPVRDYDDQLAATGRLRGPWVEVFGPAPIVVSPLSGKIDVTRGDPRFEAVMAYAHIDRLQRYFQDVLGFKGAAAINAEEPQKVIAVPVLGYDQSFYQPANDLMLLGAGGVDDGEDAEIILHEYGHAVQDAQVRGWGAGSEGGAMGEGFGDFLAAAYYAREISGGFNDLCVGEWDATSYSSSNPPCLRRVDSKKTYPKDIVPQVHADGEMWSAFMWRLRGRLIDEEDPRPDSLEASDNALLLLLSSQELLTPQANFARAVTALRTAAIALGHEEDWVPLIEAEARITGFPVQP